MQSADGSGFVIGQNGNDFFFEAGSAFAITGDAVRGATLLDSGTTQEQAVQEGVLVQQAIKEKHADATPKQPAIRGGLNINYRAYGGSCGVGGNSDCNALGFAHTKAGAEHYPSKPVQLQQAANGAQYLILPI